MAVVINGSGTVTGVTAQDELNVDSNTLVVDSSNNRVGVGTSSIGEKLDVQDTSNVAIRAKTTATNGKANLILTNDAEEMRVRINGANSDALEFCDGTTTRGAIYPDGRWSHAQSSIQHWENTGYWSLGSGVNQDVLLTSDFGANDQVYIQWAFAWNNGDGGTFGDGTMWNNYLGNHTRFRKHSETYASPLAATSIHQVGTSLYLRFTTTTGINGYWSIKIKTTGCTANNF